MSLRPKRVRKHSAGPARPAPLPFPGAGLVRLARVAEARRRIATGWYDRAEVRDSLVDAVIQEFRDY
jgi:hypothetical protein